MDYYADFTNDSFNAPVSINTVNAQRTPVHSVNVSAGQRVTLFAQCEVTNTTGSVVGVGRFIRRSDGQIIGRAVMDNVTPQMHHAVFNIAVVDPAPLPYATYSLIVYAAASSAKAGDRIVIENGYGYIQALAQ